MHQIAASSILFSAGAFGEAPVRDHLLSRSVSISRCRFQSVSECILLARQAALEDCRSAPSVTFAASSSSRIILTRLYVSHMNVVPDDGKDPYTSSPHSSESG